jgi:hypothetical protein
MNENLATGRAKGPINSGQVFGAPEKALRRLNRLGWGQVLGKNLFQALISHSRYHIGPRPRLSIAQSFYLRLRKACKTESKRFPNIRREPDEPVAVICNKGK